MERFGVTKKHILLDKLIKDPTLNWLVVVVDGEFVQTSLGRVVSDGHSAVLVVLDLGISLPSRGLGHHSCYQKSTSSSFKSDMTPGGYPKFVFKRVKEGAAAWHPSHEEGVPGFRSLPHLYLIFSIYLNALGTPPPVQARHKGLGYIYNLLLYIGLVPLENLDQDRLGFGSPFHDPVHHTRGFFDWLCGLPMEV